MKQLFLITLLAGLIAPASLMAQKVYKSGTMVVLDLTVAAGMPASSVTTLPKTWNGIPNNATGGPITNNTENGPINATVYHKLEIAPSDMAPMMNWANAFNGCQGASINGSTGWRLPTQRELMLIYIFRPALLDLGIGNFTATYYWSATELHNTQSFYVLFSDGGTNCTQKTSTCSVRCVREIQ